MVALTMSQRKPTYTERPKTVLIKSRAAFKKELEDRVSAGETLYNREVQTEAQLSDLNRDAAGWDDYNEELIKQAFTPIDNEHYLEYRGLNQLTGLYDHARGVNTNHPMYKLKHSKDKINNCVIWLKRLVEKLPLIPEDSAIAPHETADRKFYNRGFIVHGRNEARKFEVARFVEKELRKTAIILHEEANRGQTIIEKFEQHVRVDFAVALWTADDVGKLKTDEQLSDRARQNVVLETGFFIGAIGRRNVIILYEEGVEIPSDYSGVIFVRLAGNWKDELRREIDAIYHHP